MNPVGKVFLKMDLSYEGCKKIAENRKERRSFNRNASTVDIISVESEAIREKVHEFSLCDIKLVCNGYIEDEKIRILRTSEREKSFLTVGRLGTPPKATEVLLEAFANISDQHDWSLKLVGTIDESFEEYISLFYEKNPWLKDRVLFLGPIYDKTELYSVYNSSRVFILPSRSEGSPLVGPEALHCGCRMILSEAIPPMYELTNGFKHGSSIKADDIDSLSEGMLLEINRTTSDSDPEDISTYASTHLSWDYICEKIYCLMN